MMIETRRSVFGNRDFPRIEHPGLWLDSFLPHQLERNESPPAGEKAPVMAHFEKAASAPTPAFYAKSFARWQKALEDFGAQMKKGKVIGRMVVGLGADSVLENSIALHRTYGVPYIPGSALKGLASSYAHRRLEDEAWRKGGEAHTILFGDTSSAGYVTFFDALYVPDSGKNRKALWSDVITVHHPDYYQKDEEAAPADWDNPTPIPFVSATGKFLIALAGPEAWVEKAFEILGLALLEFGVGAKTSSGYGRMQLPGASLPAPPESPEAENREALMAERKKKAGLLESETYYLAKNRLKKKPWPAGRKRGEVKNPRDWGVYLKPLDGGGDVRLHKDNLRDPDDILKPGQIVEYRVEGKGRKAEACDAVILLRSLEELQEMGLA